MWKPRASAVCMSSLELGCRTLERVARECLHHSLWLNTLALSTQSKLREIPELSNVKGDGAKLLQLARSTPYVACTLVGHKTSENVNLNLDLSQVIPECRLAVTALNPEPLHVSWSAKRIS